MAAVATMPEREIVTVDSAPAAGAGTIMRRAHPASAAAMASIEEHPDWPLLAGLPMRLAAVIPLPGFRVKDLVGLKPGQLLTSAWLSTDDVLLKIGQVQLSWSEFEVVEQWMAIRLTRLA